MEVSQKVLALALLYSAGVGAALGVLYDVFRIIRVAMKPSPGMPAALKSVYDVIGDTVIFAEDILFSVSAALVVTVFLFHINDGQLRWFVLAGAGTGFTLYYVTIGHLVILCAEAIISFIRMIIRFVLSLTVIPAIKAVRFIWKLIVKSACYTERKLYTAVVMRRTLRRAERGFK